MTLENQTIEYRISNDNYALYNGTVTDITEVEGERFGKFNGKLVFWAFASTWVVCAKAPQTPAQRFQELSKQHETLRQHIIATEGEISPYIVYPELDKLATEMFYIMSGGKEYIEISADKLIAMAQ